MYFLLFALSYFPSIYVLCRPFPASLILQSPLLSLKNKKFQYFYYMRFITVYIR
jgi:hypothetical protein